MTVEEIERIRKEYARLSDLKSKLVGELTVLNRQLEEVEKEVKGIIGEEDIESAIASLEREIEEEKQLIERKLLEVRRVLDGIAGG